MEAVRIYETSVHSSETIWRYIPEESEPHTLLMKQVRNSETSVHSNETTWRYILEDSKLHTRCRESLKSHMMITA
jgi:hypothetical protein